MGIKIEMSKDEISNLMNCISITQSEIEIIKCKLIISNII